MILLTPPQQAVLEAMAQGWKLWFYRTIPEEAWLRKAYAMRWCHSATFWSLVARGLVQSCGGMYGKQQYVLTPAGRVAAEEAQG